MNRSALRLSSWVTSLPGYPYPGKLTFSAKQFRSLSLLVQHNRQQRLINLDFSVVLDKSQVPEFVHEEVNPRSRSSYHACQRLLGNFQKDAVRLFLFPVARQKQQGARQALFTRIEELIDQILFHTDVVREHIFDEMIG